MAGAKGFYIKSDLTNELKKAASDIGRYSAGAQQRMRSAIRKSTQSTSTGARSKTPRATGDIVTRLDIE